MFELVIARNCEGSDSSWSGNAVSLWWQPPPISCSSSPRAAYPTSNNSSILLPSSHIHSILPYSYPYPACTVKMQVNNTYCSNKYISISQKDLTTLLYRYENYFLLLNHMDVTGTLPSVPCKWTMVIMMSLSSPSPSASSEATVS